MISSNLRTGAHNEPRPNGIKSGGSLACQGLRSWLTGESPPALTTGFHGVGHTASDTTDSRGLYRVQRSARHICLVVASGSVAPLLFARDVERSARRYGRLVASCASGSIRIAAPDRMAAAQRRRSWRLCRAAQLGSVTSALQSARRAQRCLACPDQTRSTRVERTDLRAPLCQHALCQRVLSAGAARREAPEIRSLRLRALP